MPAPPPPALLACPAGIPQCCRRCYCSCCYCCCCLWQALGHPGWTRPWPAGAAGREQRRRCCRARQAPACLRMGEGQRARGSGAGGCGRLRRAFRLNWLPARSDAAWQSQPCQDRRLVAGGGTTVSLAAGRRRPRQQLTGLALLQPLAQRPRPLSLLLALLPPFGIGRGAAGRPGPQRDHRRRGEAIWWPSRGLVDSVTDRRWGGRRGHSAEASWWGPTTERHASPLAARLLQN